MTENEIELINMVREHDNPVQALLIATKTIVSYLMRQQSYSKPIPVDLQEQA